MLEADSLDGYSKALARNGIRVTALFALAGSGLGIYSILLHTVIGIEAALIVSGFLFSISILLALSFFRSVPIQSLATASTVYYLLYLCAGISVAATSSGSGLSVFIYLAWFPPLLVLTKMINSVAIGRVLGRIILLAPFVVLAPLFPHLIAILPVAILMLLPIMCLSYLSFGLMLNTVTGFREAYFIERERAAALRIESEVLESISDCFISLNSELKLIYLNDAACSEFDVPRHQALNRTLPMAVPGFFGSAVLAEFEAASQRTAPDTFELHREDRDEWYEMRCFPRPDGLSIYFRNITESVSARTSLESAHNRLSEQANLLDMAQDAIFLQDMDSHVLYWNKGAQRLFGWTSDEVMGLRVGDIFDHDIAGVKEAFSSVIKLGEWTGEISKRHKDGRLLMVESRCTLLRNDDGTPRAILAINTDISDRKAGEARVNQLAFFDVLTGLPNRVRLRDRLEVALAVVSPEKQVGALLHVNLDDFKTLNNTSGHDTGDHFLHSIAQRLTTAVRSEDIVARVGGDEFIVLLEALGTSCEAAGDAVRLIVDRVLDVCRQPFSLGASDYYGSACIGIILFQDSRDSADELLKRADLAMHRAKEQGRDSICFFDPAMETRLATRAALQSDLKRALLQQEFEIHYQPQLDRYGLVIGAEALLRWPHPTRGMVPPNEFIPLAEESALIIDLGYWVLQAACAELAEWHQRPDLETLNLAVNVSMHQFLDPHFVDLVEKVLRETGANPNRLKLEITESFVMKKAADTTAKMTQLRAHGVSFSMDDFGTGYSSLSQLKRLPLDQLKIDQSFIRDVLNDVTDASIVRTIIALSRTLNLSVIAEGVETQGQRDFLEKEGCYAYQGYLYSPALPAPKFRTFVEQSLQRNRKSAA
jgi:diguanylate cyclase (GGDEF)-like protein/PAS domain S-box-containing protein